MLGRVSWVNTKHERLPKTGTVCFSNLCEGSRDENQQRSNSNSIPSNLPSSAKNLLCWLRPRREASRKDWRRPGVAFLCSRGAVSPAITPPLSHGDDDHMAYACMRASRISKIRRESTPLYNFACFENCLGLTFIWNTNPEVCLSLQT